MTETADVERLLAHADWLRGLARRLVGPAAADDVVQDTLIAAMRSPPDADRPPRPWLARVMHNIARMRFRAESRRDQREDRSALAPVAAAGPEESVQRLETHRTLCEVILALAEPYRGTLVRHYYDGVALADIARADAVPEATVRWRHKHALEQIRTRLDERAGGDRRAWVASLAPIAGVPSKAATLVAGGVLVNKIVIAVTLAIIAALVVWTIVPRSPSAAPPAAPAPTAHLTFGHHAPPVAAGTTGSIHGRVRGTARARVSLFELAGDAPVLVGEQTGAQFDFRGLTAGTYCATATSGAFTGSACDLVLGADARLERDIELARRGARLHGTIGDAGGGAIAKPVVIAQRYPYGALATSHGDDAGHYELALAPGSYRVTVQASGYIATREHVDVAGDRQLDLQLNPGATIAGRVVDDQHRPAAGATVSIDPAGRTTRTDAAGRFTIDGLRPGRFDVIATSGVLVTEPRGVSLQFAANEELELVLRATAAALDGTVVDDRGEPVAACRIELRGPVAHTAATDAAGRFRITGLVAGTYDVAATASGFVRASTSTIIARETRTAITLRLARGVTVTGTVRTGTGEVVAGATVASSAWNLRDSRLDVQTDAAGAFVIGPLPSGSVRLSAFHPDHGVSEIVSLELPPGSAPAAELMFAASASIDGVVRLDDGTAAAGALVTVTTADAPASWSLVAGRDGTFTLGSLPAGSYGIEATPALVAAKQTVAGATEHVVLIAGTPAKVELEIPGGREHIRGRVVGRDGQPVVAAVWAERAGIVMSPATLDAVRTYSASDGTFELTDLQRGTYTLYGAHPDHATATRAAVAAGTTDVVLELAAGATVAGRVTSGGKPVRSFRVQWQWISREGDLGEVMSRGARMVDDPDGRFTLEPLEPTRMFIVSIETPDGAIAEGGGFALAAGERKAGLELEAFAMGGVRGRIVDRATGQPALGLEVFFPAIGSREQFPVDGNGRFEARVPAGSYDHLNLQSATQGFPDVERAFTVKPGEVTELGDVVVTLR